MTCLRSRFGGLYVFGGVFLAISLLLRLALALRGIGDMDARPLALGGVVLVGLLFDLVTYFYAALPSAVFLLLAPDRLFRWRVHRWAAVALYFLAVSVLLFDAAAEWLFWDEFSSRFNFVAVDYLIYTREVVNNIVESYPLAAIFGGIFGGALLVVLLTRRLFVHCFESTSTLRQRVRPALVFLVIPVLATLFVDQSLTDVSRDHYNNELAKNGFYSFFTALRHNSIDYDEFYLREDDATALARARALLASPSAKFRSDDPLDLAREVVHPGPENYANILIVVVESLSASYLGAFGSTEGLTPNLDALAVRSLFFRRFYATGTRTDRGLEAVALSLPPTPGRSMLKRPDNENLFSIGPIFRARGYDTKFIYSGYSTFDNMNAFFEGNGFETVDGGDFKPDEITFSNAWGVCDEDLYRRVLKECDRSADAGKPFLSVIMTTSNHRPFTHADAPGIPNDTRKGALQYTDYAIGRLIAEARSKPWFDRTVFVTLADHCASSAGKSDVTVREYHIPLFIYAPKLVAPRPVDTLASQMDLAPTLLGLLNFSYTSKFFGRDVLEGGRGRAPLGNYEKVGLFADGTLELLLPMRKVQTYAVDDAGNQTEAPLDEALLRDTMAYYQSASYLLRNHLYTPE